MRDVFARHERAALMFSGGKDSLACVYLLKPHWEKITVVWVNTGNAFPETESLVRRVAAEVPAFFEAKSDVAGFRQRYGMPADLVPIQHSAAGFAVTGGKPVMITSAYACCRANIWQPGMAAARALGATLIIRGQRADETAKAPIRSGHVEDGIEYLFPVETWTRDQVFAYLTDQGFTVPEHFGFAETSLDCLNCTAYLANTTDRKTYMQKNHPEAHRQNLANIQEIAAVAGAEFDALQHYCAD
jgi:phosphoadenosine phosphosulfate reductase